MKSFQQAQTDFDHCSDQEKQDILAQLFQMSEYANQPHSISVLFRELYDGKTFDDFHKAWFPPKDAIDTQTIDGQIYHQFFKAPIRVINAVNINNPKKIVSVGLHWLTEEQANEYAVMLKGKSDDNGKRRGEAIKHVADKTGQDIFIVQTDENLGTPF